MTTAWKPAKNTLFGITALQHSVTKELCAFGEKGQLFLFDDDQVQALEYEADGSESIHKVPHNKIKDWAKRLEIPTGAPSQIRLASIA